MHLNIRFDKLNYSDGFFEDDFGRLISSPVQPGGTAKFFSQQCSPILTRRRSLTASQVIRNRFQRRFDDRGWEIRRSSVELHKEQFIWATEEGLKGEILTLCYSYNRAIIKITIMLLDFEQ